MNVKTLNGALLRFKMLNDTPNGGFEGYGAVYGNVDRVNEIVVKDSISNLDEFLIEGFIAVGHDWTGLPIATITAVESDDYGLKITAEFHSTKAAQDARAVMNERLERGKFVGLSIGYEVVESEINDGIRSLTKLILYEVSLVTVPANPLAGVSQSKSNSLAELTLDDHAELVLAQVEGLTKRLEALNELRAKDNRTISAERRNQLSDVKQLIDKLVLLTTPKASQSDAQNAYARLLELSSDIN
jgi:HK97 family phage prohead protease